MVEGIIARIRGGARRARARGGDRGPRRDPGRRHALHRSRRSRADPDRPSPDLGAQPPALKPTRARRSGGGVLPDDRGVLRLPPRRPALPVERGLAADPQVAPSRGYPLRIVLRGIADALDGHAHSWGRGARSAASPTARPRSRRRPSAGAARAPAARPGGIGSGDPRRAWPRPSSGAPALGPRGGALAAELAHGALRSVGAAGRDVSSRSSWPPRTEARATRSARRRARRRRRARGTRSKPCSAPYRESDAREGPRADPRQELGRDGCSRPTRCRASACSMPARGEKPAMRPERATAHGGRGARGRGREGRLSRPRPGPPRGPRGLRAARPARRPRARARDLGRARLRARRAHGEVQEPGPGRRAAPCAHVARAAAGCAYQDLDYEAQLALKGRSCARRLRRARSSLRGRHSSVTSPRPEDGLAHAGHVPFEDSGEPCAWACTKRGAIAVVDVRALPSALRPR